MKALGGEPDAEQLQQMKQQSQSPSHSKQSATVVPVDTMIPTSNSGLGNIPEDHAVGG